MWLIIKVLRINRKPRKIGLNELILKIKGTTLINKYPDGKKGLDSANIFGSKRALNRILKMIIYSAKKLSIKFSPTVGNHRYTWWD